MLYACSHNLSTEKCTVCFGPLETALAEVRAEVKSATSKYPPFNSAHEAISVLREEFEELWDEVKVKQGKRDVAKLRHEAIQTAAMAIRFLMEIANEQNGQK